MINTMENIAPEELAALDLFQNCRLCLAKDKVSVDIFNEAAEVRLLYCKIVSCLPLHFSKEDDKLPRKICTQCNEKVDNFYNFWTLTAKTQKTLLDWVQQREIVTTKIKTENIAPSEISFKQEYIDNSDVDDNDRYDDDNESEEDVEPTTVVKTLCDETDGESAGPSTVNIKSDEKKETDTKCVGPKIIQFDLSVVSKVDSKTSSQCKCKLCGHVACSQTSLCLHLEECKGQKKLFQCSLCKQVFQQLHHAKAHVRKIHVKPSSCKLCCQSFFTEAQLSEHIKKQHCSQGRGSYVNYQCANCGTKTKLKSKLRAHLRTCHSTSLECYDCGKIFLKKYSLKRHIKALHLTKNECDLCSRHYSTKHKLHRHIKEVHLKKERGQRMKYACSECDKLFYCKQYLRDHQYVHTGVKTNLCNVCGKYFAGAGNLWRHLKNVHPTKPLIKPSIQCEMCGKAFSSRFGYTNHRNKIHGDGKPKCPFCGKRVTDKKSMSIHINAAHMGVKPYRCEICGGSYTTKNYLRVHMAIHLGSSIKCELCSKTFNQKCFLTRHNRQFHPELVT